MEWKWEENSVLYKVSQYTPPREIFQAVCNELGRYYKINGAKYTKSNRKIKWVGKQIRCEIGLWSSHSNIPGKWVNLEIVTSVFALNTSDMERRGILDYSVKPVNFNVYGIDYEKFFEIIKCIDNILDIIWSFETKDGIEAFLSKKSKQELEYINDNSNNLIYYQRLL